MKNNQSSGDAILRPASSRRSTAAEEVHRAAPPSISAERIDGIFSSVGQNLRDGLSGEAEKILVKTITDFSHTPDNFAHLKRLLSFTFETAGRYKESLDAVKPFEDE